ncbi:MAG: wax ester/triacylglycerol synthase family O-acyltransferase [Gammaproteobacteria bacterium]|nr:wax ester/triacylglycerol synthase family O-acyltransferase [Gammaproteobacteria bacterium]
MGKSLNALDLAFFGLETQRTPVNVAALQIFEIPSGYRGNFVRDLLNSLAESTPGPPFNQKLGRLAGVPLPQWVTDEHFDLDYHVRHSALPEPGEMSDLLRLVSRLHALVMDRERPLWEFHVIEGLRNNRFAIYMKMHHAAIDGMGGVALLEACMSKTPDGKVCAPWHGMPEKKTPDDSKTRGPAETLSRSTRGLLHQIKIMPDVGKLFASHGLKALGLKTAEAPVLFTAPKTLFNGPVSGARRFAVKSISLSAIKQLAKDAGATVNDIILAICSGALRRYLLDKDELPEKPLIANIPVSIQQINRSGNQITYVIANLATDQRMPMRRLATIHDSTMHAKAEVTEVSPSAATTFAVMAQGLVAVMNRFRIASLLPPPANVVISNVPGPRTPLYYAGARMLANYPLSVLVDGQALNITVVSYCDSVDFGLMACRDTVPDLECIAAYLGDAFEELTKAVGRRVRTARFAADRSSDGEAPIAKGV